MPVSEIYVGHGAYLSWIENLKIAQRPYWVGQDVTSCNICDDEFGFFSHLHHCRKCGTACCGKCAKYFVPVEELAYYERVRICLNCLEEIYKATKLKELQ